MTRKFARGVALTLSLLLGACVGQVRPPVPPVIQPLPGPTPVVVIPPTPPAPLTAAQAGVRLVTPTLFDSGKAVRALAAFRDSCPVLVRRADSSGLANGSDWQGVCSEAASIDPATAPAFFRDRFDWVQVGPGEAFATGYYEPEIAGSRVRMPGFEVPIHAVPADLVRCTRAAGGQGRGRIDEIGQCVLYFTRGEIDDGALAGRGLELGYAADPVDLFFLQIQGSGRVRLPDGQVMRIGYASQNGRDYVAIGKLLRDRGALPPGAATMKGIVAWIHAHPDEGRELMRENSSYIFFKELTGRGPLGALNVPVTPQSSVAADPKFVPLGAPVFLDMERDEADGLWIAQDTGGAIKGANRFDTFWGAGLAAEATAGGMSAKGRALILLPKGVAARARPIP